MSIQIRAGIDHYGFGTDVFYGNREKRSTDSDFQVTVPFGSAVTARQEPNRSTTLTFSLADGRSYSWNSGVFIVCKILGTGVSLLGLPAGKHVQGLIQVLATTGCTYITSSSTQDGDS
jgi:hypothetical protein